MSQHFNAPVVYSANGIENMEDSDDEDSIYVVSDFEGETFRQLCNSYCRIVAPPVIIWAATRGEVGYFLSLHRCICVWCIRSFCARTKLWLIESMFSLLQVLFYNSVCPYLSSSFLPSELSYSWR